MTEPLPIKTIYADAADILEDHGHCRGTWGDAHEGPVCVGRAILIAAGRENIAASFVRNRNLFEPLRARVGSVVNWNDDPAVSPETIIRTLRELAA